MEKMRKAAIFSEEPSKFEQAKNLAKALDESGAFKTRTTRQLTGRGYSIGLIADPSFVFLTIANTDAVLFRDNDSVIEYYAKVTSVF